ncbi:MAG: hypothetical protein CL529_11970 [Aequorivita sp.]|nr:hypothetical protein [Aequorivita sp.]|tara:strand:+ start:29629 stop:29814 length:186 start_codon:yes stop_codon:yes gene_type:complete
MGHNFPETAGSNIDKEKYDKNFNSIFGKREKIDCKKCDLSSKQKKGEEFTCPHCGFLNEKS